MDGLSLFMTEYHFFPLYALRSKTCVTSTERLKNVWFCSQRQFYHRENEKKKRFSLLILVWARPLQCLIEEFVIKP